MPLWTARTNKPPAGTPVSASVWGTVPPPLFAYAFNEGAGKTVYDSVGGFPGTLTNGPTWSASPYGPAISFDGTQSQYIELNDPTPWVETTGSFSLGVVLSQNGGATGNAGGVISRGSTVGISAVFDISSWSNGVTWHFELYDGTNNPIASEVYTPTKWDVIFGVRDVKAGRIYLYGAGEEVISAVDNTGNLNVGTQHWTIGRRADQGVNAGYFNGKIASVVAWNVALSPTAVKSLTGNFWQIWQPSSAPSYFLFTPITSVVVGVAAVTAVGTPSAASEQTIASEGSVLASGTLGGSKASLSPSFAGILSSGTLGVASEQFIVSETSVLASSATATATESILISEVATTSVGTAGTSSYSFSGSASAAAVSASGALGSISVIAGSAISLSVSAVTAIASPPGTGSWQQAQSQPASMTWLSISGTSAVWQALPLGTSIVVTRYDGATYSDFDAFTVANGTLVDPSGASTGVDSLWYWDLWAYITTGVVAEVIVGKGAVSGSTLYGTTSVLAVVLEASVATSGSVGTITVGTGTIIAAAGVSASGIVGGETASTIVLEASVATSGIVGGETASAIVLEASVTTSGSVGTITAGTGTVVTTASVSASGVVGGETALVVISEASVTTAGATGSFSVIAGTTLTVTASAVFASGVVGVETVLSIVSEATVTASGALGVQTAGPAPVASAVFASGTVGITTEPRAIGLVATTTSGLPAIATAGPVVLSSGVTSSSAVGASRAALVIVETAALTTGSTASISIFNGGMITVSTAGVSATGIAGSSQESLLTAALAVLGIGIPGSGSPQVTLYIKAYPDPFASSASTQIDAFESMASEKIDPFGSSAGYRRG